MIPRKHFYMIRHGETEANAARIMAGSLDSPLTENGRNQARAIHVVIEALSVRPARIIHSQLSRARDTAMIINEALSVAIHEDPDYAELHAGDWEGVPYDDCPQLLKDWIDPPGGESCNDFFARIKRAKIRALEDETGPVMIVTHGGVFRAFLKLHNINLEGVKNCMLYEFEPMENLEGKPTSPFPWNVWRYDIENTPDGTVVIRRPVTLTGHDPGAEIAA